MPCVLVLSGRAVLVRNLVRMQCRYGYVPLRGTKDNIAMLISRKYGDTKAGTMSVRIGSSILDTSRVNNGAVDFRTGRYADV